MWKHFQAGGLLAALKPQRVQGKALVGAQGANVMDFTHLQSRFLR